MTVQPAQHESAMSAETFAIKEGDVGAARTPPPGSTSPYFEKIVTVVLATFTVFTGFTINKAVVATGDHIPLPDIKDGEFPLVQLTLTVWSTIEFWALIALLALLLRFLMGSAIHLTDTYVKRLGDPENPKLSESTLSLFKDLGFLVVFGIVVLMIAKPLSPPAPPFDFPAFVFGCELFLLCGLVWSGVDAIWRRVLGIWWSDEWFGRKAYKWWPKLDAGQFIITWLISYVGGSDLVRMRWLAVIYCIFLIADIALLIETLRERAIAKA